MSGNPSCKNSAETDNAHFWGFYYMDDVSLLLLFHLRWEGCVGWEDVGGVRRGWEGLPILFSHFCIYSNRAPKL